MKKIVSTLLTTLLIVYINVFSCTDFRLIGKDGTVLITRSMEFAIDMKSNLRTSLRGREFKMTDPQGKEGLAWKATYGYVFLDFFNVDGAVDGMNEAGLSVEALLLPAYAEYQTVPKGQESKSLPYMYLGDWILSQFKTVDEVRKAILGIYVFAQKLPSMENMVFPVHFAVYDATGKGIVIEYVGGKLNLYDNAIGVMTNSPTYDWHVKNLVNYIHLAPVNPPNVVDNGMIFAATGQGFGMVGLPGDMSPPSRFIKTAVLTRVSLPVANASDTLNLAQHIINNVDIPRGLVREPDQGNKPTNDMTQWVVFKDLTNKIFYYRTYDDMTLRGVSLRKIDFSKEAKRLMMPIMSPPFVRDMTDQFTKSLSSP